MIRRDFGVQLRGGPEEVQEGRGQGARAGPYRLAHAERTGAPVALAIADLDHFKAVNDTHGHLTGDAVLAAAAAVLRRGLRPYDLLGRFGGEEFTILLPHTSADEAQQVAERLRDSFAAHSMPCDHAAGPLHVTISIGVAATGPAHHDLTDLLTIADAALYRANTSGRNAVILSAASSESPACEPA